MGWVCGQGLQCATLRLDTDSFLYQLMLCGQQSALDMWPCGLKRGHAACGAARVRPWPSTLSLRACIRSANWGALPRCPARLLQDKPSLLVDCVRVIELQVGRAGGVRGRRTGSSPGAHRSAAHTTSAPFTHALCALRPYKYVAVTSKACELTNFALALPRKQSI